MDDNWIHSTEQYIQLKKAEFFNDRQSALKILTAETAIEFKQLARQIKNYDVAKWNDVAEDECFEGILEKFTQNPILNNVLQNDRKWGTGVPLHSPDALNSECWIGDNLLGRILSNVRETLRVHEDVD